MIPYWMYLLLALGSLAVGVLGTVLWMFNPVPVLLLTLAEPAVRLLGRQFYTNERTGFGMHLWITFAWALPVAPAHLISYRVLGWGPVGFLVLFLAASFLVAFIPLYRGTNSKAGYS